MWASQDGNLTNNVYKQHISTLIIGYQENLTQCVTCRNIEVWTSIHVIPENEMCDLASIYFTRLHPQRINQHSSHLNALQLKKLMMKTHYKNKEVKPKYLGS